MRPVRCTRGSRRRRWSNCTHEDPGPQSRSRGAACPDIEGRVPGCARALRPVRRALRSRNAGPGARPARAGHPRHPAGSRIQGRARPAAAHLGGPAHAAHLCRRAVQALGRGSLAEAGRPGAHRRPQDQQRNWPGPAGEATRREAHRRGNRRRPARCGHCRGLRAARHALHGVHGLDRHGAPGAERRPHETARRERRAGHGRRQDVARRDRRGVARLGVRPGRHVLHPRFGCRSASVPVHGARVPARHRRRGARADAGAGGRAARRRRGLRRWRFECDRPVPSVRARPRRQVAWLRGRRHGPRPGTERGVARVRHARRAAGLLFAVAAGRARPDPGDALGLRRASTTRASDPSMRCSPASAVSASPLRKTTSRWPRLPSAASTKASCRPSKPPMHLRAHANTPRRIQAAAS